MKIEVNIPESLDEIQLHQYQDYSNIKDPSIDDLLKSFLRLTQDQIDKFPASYVTSLTARINEVLMSEDKQFTPIFVMDGVRYGFIPKLDDITYGENKDLTSYLEKSQLNKAMSVMYRPIDHERDGKYTIEKYEGSHELQEKMKLAPLSVFLGATVFFYNLTRDLMNSIPNYLKEMSEQMDPQALEKNGDSMRKLLHLLTIRFRELSELKSVHL